MRVVLVASPQEQAIGVCLVIAEREVPHGEDPRHDPRVETDMGWAQHVWRSERIRQTKEPLLVIAVGTLCEYHRFRTRSLAHLIHALRNAPIGFRPGDASEPSGASRTIAEQRM